MADVLFPAVPAGGPVGSTGGTSTALGDTEWGCTVGEVLGGIGIEGTGSC